MKTAGRIMRVVKYRPDAWEAVLGVKYVIIGHSERREYFGESDEMRNCKVKAATLPKVT